MEKNSKIYIAGHRGLVGSAILRRLENDGFENIIHKTHSEIDLTNQEQVKKFFAEEKPEYVFLAAAKVGGIMANNTYPAEFIYQNLQIQNNVMHYAYENKVTKLLFLGSVCIYPKHAPIPVKEEYLLTGPLESTNEPYAIAKIAGMKMAQSYNRQYGTNFISVMPANLYGPGDNFNLETSHVIPALIRKFHEAKLNNTEVTLWGSGSPRREFLHVDDMADGCIHLMNNFNPTKEQNEKGEIFFNLGADDDIPIKDLAEVVKNIVGYQGNISWDTSKPDGTPRRKMDISRMEKLGWKNTIGLKEGIRDTYKWFLENFNQSTKEKNN